jgi:DNA-binding transcriptional ArsR family regulator
MGETGMSGRIARQEQPSRKAEVGPEPHEADASDVVRALAALSDENRYRIVELLARSEEEIPCGAIGSALKLSPSLTSHHLSILEAAGLIIRRKNGFWTLNRLCREQLSRYVLALESLLDGAVNRDSGRGRDPGQASVREPDGAGDTSDRRRSA